MGHYFKFSLEKSNQAILVSHITMLFKAKEKTFELFDFDCFKGLIKLA